MDSYVYYVSGTDGSEYDLHDAELAMVPKGSGIHSRAWSLTLAYRSARGATNPAREIVMAYIASNEHADELRRAFDADLENGKPGTLVYRGWRMKCYVFDETTSDTYGGYVARDARVAMLDGFWWKESKQYFPSGLDNTGLNHDYNFEHNYGYSAGKAYIKVDSMVGALPRLTFYGPCASPYVTIGRNRYEVDQTVLSGYSLVIDATSDMPTAKLYDPYGNSESVFSKAVRDGGKGGGSYAFEPLKHGTLEVAWSGAFAFELAWRERETEPPWAR